MFWLRNKKINFQSHILKSPALEVIKLVSCSTQLSMKFQRLIKTKILKINIFYALKLLFVVFILLVNVKMHNCCSVEHEKGFITLGPDMRMFVLHNIL